VLTFTGQYRLCQQPKQRRPGSSRSPSSPGLTVIFIAVLVRGGPTSPHPFLYKHTRRRLVPVVAGRRPRWHGVRFPTAETFQATCFVPLVSVPFKGYDLMASQSRLEVLVRAYATDLDMVLRKMGDEMPTEDQAAQIVADLAQLRRIRNHAMERGYDNVECVARAAEDLVADLPASWVSSAIDPVTGLVLLKAR
jgi:hypothetical protein